MMLRRVLMMTFLAVLFLGCVGQQTRPDEDKQREADYNYKMGISSLNEGNIKMAYVQLHKAYELDPNNKDILNGLGIVFMQIGEFDKALRYFKRVLELDSRYSEAYNNIGVILLQSGRFNEAIEAFKGALSNPLYQYPERAYYNLGNAYYRMGRYEDAIRSFEGSVRLMPDFVMSYYGLALALNKKGDYGGASTMLNMAISLDQKYKGNRDAYKRDLQKQLTTAKGGDLSDIYDYLEILNY
jgi:type IV pilus biogenesis/stability protein PilW